MPKKKRKDLNERAAQQATASAPVFHFRHGLLIASLFAAAALLAYANSFRGAFIFDDKYHIVDNRSIQSSWLPWKVWSESKNLARPLISLSFAANYAISGLNTWSYHAFNLAIHVLAALTLFGILRRTFLTARLRPYFQGASTPLALTAALLWMLHPLQTQAVTYVVQRAESLMGLLYLFTLYAVIRGFDSPRAIWWNTAAVLSCALGMSCKPVMASAPLLVLLYDAIFLSGSLRAALRRWKLHAALAATWIVLALIIMAAPAIETAGFGVKDLTAWQYLRTQSGVILYYLHLAFWPDALSIDYFDWPVASTLEETLPKGLVILVLLLASGWALYRSPAWGILGAWFFLILAPTSSIMPIQDLLFEHRMYLSLATVVTAFICGAYLLFQRRLARGEVRTKTICVYSLAAVVPLAVILGWSTARRNADYQSEERIWASAVAQRPRNARAQYNLGLEFLRQERNIEAVQCFQEALKLRPHYAEARNNLGNALAALGRRDEAMLQYEEALKLADKSPEAYSNLANELSALGRRKEAIQYYEEALRITKPNFYDAYKTHFNLANALAAEGRLDDAVKHYNESLRLEPGYGEAHCNLGLLFAGQGKYAEAVQQYKQALKGKPGFYIACYNMGVALGKQGKVAEAIKQYEEALRIKPDYAEVHYNLANTLSGQGKKEEAIQHFQEALRSKPEYPEACNNLGVAYLDAGKPAEAEEQFRKLLRLTPESASAHFALGHALELQEKTTDAIAQFREALRLRPNYPAALERLQFYKAMPPR